MGVDTRPWRVGDETSRLLLDIAADRQLDLARPLTDEELGLVAEHGLVGILATSDRMDLRAEVVAAFVRHSARQEKMRNHLRRLLEMLWDKGLPATVLKGPHLAEWGYRNADHRTYTDIDILVHREDIEAVVDALGSYPNINGIPPKTPKADKRNIPLRDSSGVSFTIDLHWDMFSYTQLKGTASGATRGAWADAWAEEDALLGPMWNLPIAARIAFLGTHAVLDHRFRLILFRDLQEVARHKPDWNQVFEYTERYNLRSTTYVSLLFASRLSDADVPQEVLDELRPRSLPVRAVELLAPRTDLVRFDGHRPHPLNLAMVLLNDDRATRARLAVHAPLSFPHWRQRVEALRTPGTIKPQRGSIMTIVASNRRRGAEVFGERLSEGLQGQGWDVDFVSLSRDDGGPWVSATSISDRSTRDLGRLRPGIVSALRDRIKRRQPDIVFANGGATLRYSVAAVRTLRNRPLLVYASIGEPSFWLRDDRHRLLQSVLHKGVDLVVAVSEMTGNQLAELVAVPPEKIRVAHTGIPEDFMEVPDPEPHEELRMLFLGNLSDEKDPFDALHAVAALGTEFAVKIRFVGGGPLGDAVKTHASRLGISDLVELTGSVDDVRPHLEWADVLLLTSRTEGFPGAIVEAAAAGVPSVAYDVGGTAETMIDGKTGVLVEGRDLATLVGELKRFRHDRERRDRFGAAARDLAAERFTMPHAVARHDAILREILASGPATRS